jgi:hypothetical protein
MCNPAHLIHTDDTRALEQFLKAVIALCDGLSDFAWRLDASPTAQKVIDQPAENLRRVAGQMLAARPAGEVRLTPLFWDCECVDDYIHPASQEVCLACNTTRDEQPDSRVEEVLRHAFDFGLPVELVRVVQAGAPDLAELTAIPF